MSYAKLRGLIREKYGDQASFAVAVDMHPTTLSSKLNGKTDWTRAEIERVCAKLGISLDQAPAYFFGL